MKVNMSKIIFFSYGSNMHLPRLRNERRCPSAKILGVYCLDDYEFAYSKLSTDGSAKANIIHKKGAKVFGLLTAIEDSELTNLRRAEGCQPDGTPFNNTGYHERTVIAASVETRETVEAKAYISPSIKCEELPYDWYIKHVVAGAKAFGFDEQYIGQYLNAFHKNDDDYERRKREFAFHSQ